MKSMIHFLLLLVLVAGVRAQPELPGFPITFTKANVPGQAADRGPLVCDVTGDGVPEIIVVAARSQGSQRDLIPVFDSTHTTEAKPLFVMSKAYPALA